MAESSPVVLASDQPAFPVIISGGGGGSSSAAGLTVVTPDPALFYDPLVIFVNSTTEWRAVHFDSQVLDPVSSAVFSAIPFQLAVSSDLTQLWAWEGVTAGTQVFQKSLLLPTPLFPARQLLELTLTRLFKLRQCIR